MSGRLTSPVDWLEDVIIGRLLTPQEAAGLSAPQLEVISAHIRSEILFSPEIHQHLSAKAREVLRELEEQE